MKTLKLVIVGFLLFFTSSIQAQISVRVNLGTPPQWGPVGYSDVRYYYLPDVEAYYDISSSMFIYNNGYNWVHRSSLPTRYRNYDLYNGYKVPMSEYHGDRPYSNFRQHKMQYARGYRGQEQHTIGDRPNNGNYSRDRSDQKFRENYNQRDNRDNFKNKANGRTREKENRRKD